MPRIPRHALLAILLASSASGCAVDRTDAPEAPSRAAPEPLLALPQQKLLADDGMTFDSFGYAVAISGDTAIVGAIWNDELGSDAGAAYVYLRSGGTFTQQQKLLPSDGEAFDYFGWSVAIDGDTAIVGATGDDDKGLDAGAAYVFVRSGNVWTQQGKLLALDGEQEDAFGYSVALSGDTALVGAQSEDTKGIDAGAAYVYLRTNGAWSEQQKLVTSDGADGDLFGTTVALFADTAVVGAPYDDDKGISSGSAYAWIRSGTTWSEQHKFIAADGVTGDQFGSAVALSGDTVIVGAPYDDDKGSSSGSGYVFVRAGTTWSQQQKLLASDGLGGDRFGSAVALDGDRAMLTSPYDDDKGTSTGAAYVFSRAMDKWSQEPKIVPADGEGNDYFGWSVSISGDTLVVGSWGDSDKGASSGSAYTFVLKGEKGESCAAASDCVSGHCVDTVCCDSACGDGADDCEACNQAGSMGSCLPLPAGTVCRAALGDCDIAETCDGASAVCPADALAASGEVCRAAQGQCDLAEACDGASLDCPADKLLADGESCAGGVCMGGVCEVGSGGGAGTGTGTGTSTSGSTGAGGSMGAGGSDAGAESGCACNVAGEEGERQGPGLLLALGALAALVRRRAAG